MEDLRVLITDDEMSMRLGVLRTLRGFTVCFPDVNGQVGFTVQQAESGERALEIIAAQPPDILLLDHRMPSISGLEVLDQIARDPSDMLTIMITGYAPVETAVTATKRGAYDFLAKPFTPDELKAAIRKAAHCILLGKRTRNSSKKDDRSVLVHPCTRLARWRERVAHSLWHWRGDVRSECSSRFDLPSTRAVCAEAPKLRY